MTVTDRLNELHAHVSQLAILPLMDGSDAVEELLCDCWYDLPKLLGFSEQQLKEAPDYLSSTEYLSSLGIEGVFFAVEGDIYKSCINELEGEFENLVSMHRYTGRRAVEYGYAPSLDELDEAMNKVLDKLVLRLLED